MQQYKIKWANGQEIVLAYSNIDAIKRIKTKPSDIITGDLVSVKEKDRCLTKYIDSETFWKYLKGE